MKITDVKATVVRQPSVMITEDGSQDTVIIEINTDAQITGYGEVDSAPFLVKQIIDMPSSHEICRGIKEMLIGKDPFDNRVISSMLYESTYYYGRCGAAIHAISGVDMALWDIKGKALNLPVYKLLGGCFNKCVPAYCSAIMPKNEDDIARIVDEQMPKGYCGIKFSWGAFGHSKEKDIELAYACRKALGPKPKLIIDMGMRWPSAKYANEVCKEFERFGIEWVEDPLKEDDFQENAELRKKSAIEISGGEELSWLNEFDKAINNKCFDILQPDISRCGGLTIAKQIAEMAELKGLRVQPHAFKTDILLSASLQLIASCKNAFIVEFGSKQTLLSKTLASGNYFMDEHGLVHITDNPGLGFEINKEIFEKYSIKQ